MRESLVEPVAQGDRTTFLTSSLDPPVSAVVCAGVRDLRCHAYLLHRAGSPVSGPHTCTAFASPVKPSPQASVFIVFYVSEYL